MNPTTHSAPLARSLQALHDRFLADFPEGDPSSVRSWASTQDDLRDDWFRIARLESMAVFVLLERQAQRVSESA